VNKCSQAGLYDFMQQLDPPGKLFAAVIFCVFREAPSPNEFSEAANVLLEKDWIVNDFLVTLVTEGIRLSFCSPRTLTKDRRSLLASPIGRASKEPLCNVVMLCCVGAALKSWPSIGSAAVHKMAAT